MIRRPSDPVRGRDDGAILSTSTRDHLPRTLGSLACATPCSLLMSCTCATASSFSALQRSCCELPRIKPSRLLVFATGPSLTLALSTHRYGIAQAFGSASRTHAAPAPAPTALLSHARGVPCLGFCLWLRRRSRWVRTTRLHLHRPPSRPTCARA